MTLKAIRNHIVFQFLDKVNNEGQFIKPTTQSGLYLGASFDDSAKSARWARILATGPECCSHMTVPGCEILIENLKWTLGATHEGQKFWRTDETCVLAYRHP